MHITPHPPWFRIGKARRKGSLHLDTDGNNAGWESAGESGVVQVKPRAEEAGGEAGYFRARPGWPAQRTLGVGSARAHQSCMARLSLANQLPL